MNRAENRYERLKTELVERRSQYDNGLTTYVGFILGCQNAIQHYEDVEYGLAVKYSTNDYERVNRLSYIVERVSIQVNALEINTSNNPPIYHI